MADARKVPQLGDKVRDRVTGMEGIIVARTEHLNMCDRYTVQPQVSKEKPDEYPKAWSIDIFDLEVIEENAIKLSAEELKWHGRTPQGAGETKEITEPGPEVEEPLRRTGGPSEVVEAHRPAERVR